MEEKEIEDNEIATMIVPKLGTGRSEENNYNWYFDYLFSIIP